MRPSRLPDGTRAASATRIGRPSPVARPVAVSAPLIRGSSTARSARRASKPMSVRVLEMRPFEAKLSCGFSMRRSSVRMPVSSRTARPETVVSPASSASSRASPSARSVVPPSKAEIEAARERADAADRRRSIAPPSGRSAMPAKIARSATRIELRPV